MAIVTNPQNQAPANAQKLADAFANVTIKNKINGKEYRLPKGIPLDANMRGEIGQAIRGMIKAAKAHPELVLEATVTINVPVDEDSLEEVSFLAEAS